MLHIGVSIKIINRMANSVDPDETARSEPSHLDLHCLQSVLDCRAERLKSRTDRRTDEWTDRMTDDVQTKVPALVTDWVFTNKMN